MLLSRSFPVVSPSVRVVRLAVWGPRVGARFSVRFRFWWAPGVVGEVLCLFRSRVAVARVLRRFRFARVCVSRFSSAWSPSALPFPRFGLRWLALRACVVSVFGVSRGRVRSSSFRVRAVSLGSARDVAFVRGGLAAVRALRRSPVSAPVSAFALGGVAASVSRLRC